MVSGTATGMYWPRSLAKPLPTARERVDELADARPGSGKACRRAPGKLRRGPVAGASEVVRRGARVKARGRRGLAEPQAFGAERRLLPRRLRRDVAHHPGEVAGRVGDRPVRHPCVAAERRSRRRTRGGSLVDTTRGEAERRRGQRHECHAHLEKATAQLCPLVTAPPRLLVSPSGGGRLRPPSARVRVSCTMTVNALGLPVTAVEECGRGASSVPAPARSPRTCSATCWSRRQAPSTTR